MGDRHETYKEKKEKRKRQKETIWLRIPSGGPAGYTYKRGRGQPRINNFIFLGNLIFSSRKGLEFQGSSECSSSVSTPET